MRIGDACSSALDACDDAVDEAEDWDGTEGDGDDVAGGQMLAVLCSLCRCHGSQLTRNRLGLGSSS